MALALAAMVATTTFAHADALGVTSSGQLGFSGGGVTTNTTAYTWANNNCLGAACGTTPAPPGILGYNFVFSSWATTLTGAGASTGESGNVGFVGTSLQYDPGCTASCSVLALEADNYGRAPVDLTLGGLTSGDTYSLTFGWDEDQQLASTCQGTAGCSGNYEADLGVTNVGGSTAINALYVDAAGAAQTDQTFTQPWTGETVTFVANGTSEELAFLAGSDLTSQVPAFALVDNFAVAQVTTPPIPEPNSLLLLSTGLLGLGGFLRMRIKSGAASRA